MWSAYLFQITSGAVGPRLNYSSMSWQIDLNATETLKVVLPKSDLPKIDSEFWLEPLWAGVLLCWNNTPLVAGPILSRTNETSDSVTLDCKGIRAILARRLAIKELSDWNDLAKSTLPYYGRSLGTIVKDVVKDLQKKPGGNLPISYPVADEFIADDADHQRIYRGFNLANINGDQVLTKLSNVSRGPDIMFKPRYIRENLLTFDLWHGTEKQPRIYQPHMITWDTTAQQGEVSEMSVIVTGAYMTDRVFSLGAGTDEGQLITVSYNDSLIQKGFPLVESVIQTSDSENASVVKSHGDASLAANLQPLLEVQMTVRGDGINPFGSFWPGDECDVVVKDWLALKDGVHRMRILSMTGDTSSSVRISLQLA